MKDAGNEEIPEGLRGRVNDRKRACWLHKTSRSSKKKFVLPEKRCWYNRVAEDVSNQAHFADSLESRGQLALRPTACQRRPALRLPDQLAILPIHSLLRMCAAKCSYVWVGSLPSRITVLRRLGNVCSWSFCEVTTSVWLDTFYVYQCLQPTAFHLIVILRWTPSKRQCNIERSLHYYISVVAYINMHMLLRTVKINHP